MLYEFKCPKCKKKTEVKCSIKEYDDVKKSIVCQSCGTKLERVIQGFGGITFKGKGFYCNDKRGNR